MFYIIRFLPILIGTIGSFCNIIIFRSKEFRLNSCGFYFLCSTIFDLIYLLISGITGLINDFYPQLSSDESIIYCKFRTYFVVVTPTISVYFLMFASIDRCISTLICKKWRRFNDINVAWCISIFSLIFLLICYIHILFYFQLEKKGTYKCIPNDGLYKLFFAICLLLSSPFLIYMIMLISTIITLIRIRSSRYRTKYFYNKRSNIKSRNLDRHLIRIIFIQVGLGMLLTFFRCGFLVYIFSTNNIKKTQSQINFDIFFDKCSLIIYYINFAKSFPVNILTSTLFRQVFKQQFNRFIKSICHIRQGTFCFKKS